MTQHPVVHIPDYRWHLEKNGEEETENAQHVCILYTDRQYKEKLDKKRIGKWLVGCP